MLWSCDAGAHKSLLHCLVLAASQCPNRLYKSMKLASHPHRLFRTTVLVGRAGQLCSVDNTDAQWHKELHNLKLSFCTSTQRHLSQPSSHMHVCMQMITRACQSRQICMRPAIHKFIHHQHKTQSLIHQDAPILPTSWPLFGSECQQTGRGHGHTTPHQHATSTQIHAQMQVTMQCYTMLPAPGSLSMQHGVQGAGAVTPCC